jgi:hypothetical protein
MENQSPVTRWAGRTTSALPALFLLVDGAMKLVKPEVVKATVEVGYSESVIFGLGIVLLACRRPGRSTATTCLFACALSADSPSTSQRNRRNSRIFA